jgi:hypothetical protein
MPSGRESITSVSGASRLAADGLWWAHLQFTRINIEPIILRKKIEDLPIRGAFCAPKSAKSVSQSRVGFHSRTNKGGRAHRRRVTTIRGSFKTLDIDRYLGQIVVELMVPSPQATNNGVRN